MDPELASAVGRLVGCVVLQVMLGAVWYGPIAGQLFLNLAFSKSIPKKSPKVALTWSVIMAACVTLILSWVISSLKIRTLEGGLTLAVVLWLLDFCLHLAHPLFEERPVFLHIIHSFYHLLCLVTVCGVLTTY